MDKEIENGSFTVRTEDPNVRLSWQITGTRIDPYATQNPLQVVTDKPADDKGQYLDPQACGADASQQAGPDSYGETNPAGKLASSRSPGR